MRTMIMSRHGRFQNELSLADALNDPHSIIWLDIQDATEEDVALLSEQFDFHPLAIEDAIRAHERPKVDAYGVANDIDDASMAEPGSSSMPAVDSAPTLPVVDRDPEEAAL